MIKNNQAYIEITNKTFCLCHNNYLLIIIKIIIVDLSAIIINYHFTIVSIVILILIVVTVWKRRLKRKLQFTETPIQLNDYDKNYYPEYMNLEDKLGSEPKLTKDPIYESLEQLPENENYESLRCTEGQVPLPPPNRSRPLTLEPFTDKGNEDNISTHSKQSDYIQMNATNPISIEVGDCLQTSEEK